MTALRPLLLAAALALLSVLPAGADLAFPRAPHAGQAAAIWARLPAPLHSIHGTVRELTEGECRGGGWDDDIAGMAWFGGEIELRGSCWDAAYLIHEIGHLVWWQRLSDADRAEWLGFWRKHPKGMPRDYARSDDAEGWADCFSVVYSPPDAGTVNLGGIGAGVSALIRRLAEKAGSG